MGSLLVLESLRLVSQRTARLVSMLCSPTPLVSSSSSLLSTRWTPPSLPTARPVSRRSKKRYLLTSRRSATTPRPLLLSPSQDGTETTCWSHLRTWDGSRDGKRRVPPKLTKTKSSPEPPFFRLLTTSLPQSAQLRSPFVSPSRMYTR